MKPNISALAIAAAATLAACNSGDSPQAEQVLPATENGAAAANAPVPDEVLPIAGENGKAASQTGAGPPPPVSGAPSPQPTGAPPPAAPPSPPAPGSEAPPALEQDYTTGNGHAAHPPG
jgi:hypothetical protein